MTNLFLQSMTGIVATCGGCGRTVYSEQDLTRHERQCSRLLPTSHHYVTIGFPPPCELLDVAPEGRPENAYYCLCGELFDSYLQHYVHIFACPDRPDWGDNEPKMTAGEAMQEVNSRCFRLHPRVIQQVCSSCFRYKTIDNWSMNVHWKWCVGEGAIARELQRRQNREYLTGHVVEEVVEEISSRDDDWGSPSRENIQTIRDAAASTAAGFAADESARRGAMVAIEQQRAQRAIRIARDATVNARVDETGTGDEQDYVIGSQAGESGSLPCLNDFSGEESGESYYSPGQAHNDPTPSDASDDYPLAGQPMGPFDATDDEQVENHGSAPEYEVEGHRYQSDLGLGTEWETGAESVRDAGKPREPEEGESRPPAMCWRNTESDLWDWRYAGRRNRSTSVTSETSLDSRLCGWTSAARCEKRTREDEPLSRVRRQRMELRARRERRLPVGSDTEDE